MWRGRAKRWAAVVLSVAGAGCGRGKGTTTTGTGSEIESYCRQLAERTCSTGFVCYPQTAMSTEADCVTDVETACLAEAHAWQIPGVMAGRLSFDSNAATACLAGADQGPCGLPWPSDPDCKRVFVPRVPKGGGCLNDGECEGGICDRTSTCPGVCAAPGQAGDDCTHRPCDTATATCMAASAAATPTCVARVRGMACADSTQCAAADFCQSPSDLTPCLSVTGGCVCGARGSDGAACTKQEQCAPGLGCAGGACRAAVSARGEPCSYAQGVYCAAGLACIITDGRYNALSGTCGTMLPVDSPCYWVECERGLQCEGSSIDAGAPVQGTCRPRAQPGEACRAFGCTLGYLCDKVSGVCIAKPGAGAYCDAIGGGEAFCYGHDLTCDHYSGGMCTTPPGVGAPCSEACATGLHCDFSATNTCLSAKAAGANCSDDRECASGTCSLFVCAPDCSAADL